MSERIDDILDLIDAGLQSSPEEGYGCDHADLCARCQRLEPAEGGDMCTGCREYLLGDTDDDPARSDVQPYLDEVHRTVRTLMEEAGMMPLEDWQHATTLDSWLGHQHFVVHPDGTMSEFRPRVIRGHHPTFVVTDELAQASWATDNDCQEWVDGEGVWWRSVDGGPPERCRNA